MKPAGARFWNTPPGGVRPIPDSSRIGRDVVDLRDRSAFPRAILVLQEKLPEQHRLYAWCPMAEYMNLDDVVRRMALEDDDFGHGRSHSTYFEDGRVTLFKPAGAKGMPIKHAPWTHMNTYTMHIQYPHGASAPAASPF